MKTQLNEITIKGLNFITYKHWSYDGNVGIYLNDKVSKVGEIISGDIVFRKDFSDTEKLWLEKNYSEYAKVILA